MTSLISLLEKYQSIDNHYGTDKNTSHSYGELYEDLFKTRREHVKHILEIGVFSGASAQVWTEYFPNAQVDGVDISLRCVRFGNSNPRITFHEKDGTLPCTKAAFENTLFDVIIDDGSHHPEHQIKSFGLFAPLLNTNGMYIIEDISCKHADRVHAETLKIAEYYGLRTEWYDLREKKGRWDDIVGVFYRDIENEH